MEAVDHRPSSTGPDRSNSGNNSHNTSGNSYPRTPNAPTSTTPQMKSTVEHHHHHHGHNGSNGSIQLMKNDDSYTILEQHSNSVLPRSPVSQQKLLDITTNSLEQEEIQRLRKLVKSKDQEIDLLKSNMRDAERMIQNLNQEIIRVKKKKDDHRLEVQLKVNDLYHLVNK
jgi:hypothetical protein